MDDQSQVEIEKKFIYQELVTEKDVLFKVQDRSFRAEQLMAHFLGSLKKAASAEQMVLSVPSHSSHSERQAVLDSARIAGIDSVRLMSDHSAIAVAWAYSTKTKLMSSDERRTVCFVDMGLSSSFVAVAQFQKQGEKMGAKMLYQKSERNLGARDFDHNLLLHFKTQIYNDTKVDITDKPKVILRLLKALTK